MRHITSLAKEIFQPDRERHAIPPLDGALRPNTLLEESQIVMDGLPGPCGLCASSVQAFLASGQSILSFGTDAAPKLLHSVDGQISALYYDEPGEGLLAGIAGRGVIGVGGRFDGRRWASARGVAISNPTGIAMVDDAILVTEGSTTVEPGDWRRDLLQKSRSGRLIRLDARSDGGDVLLDGLQYPAGVAASPEARSTLFTESWSHALRAFGGTHRNEGSALGFDNSPGYPGHIAPASSGGFWIAFFALRTHLIEFLLGEDGYRKEMIRTVPEEFWIAPSLSPSDQMLVPLQFGQIKVLGMTKPWAPPRSYGLVVEYDQSGRPVRSLHSRNGGRLHGITSTCEFAGSVFATSHAASALIRLPGAMR